MSASSTAASSTLSRSRAAILIFTTIAAAYSVYYLQTSFYSSQQNANPTATVTRLRRSNAVHRRRRRTQSVDGELLVNEQSRIRGSDDDEDDGDGASQTVRAGDSSRPTTAGLRPLADEETVVDETDDGPWPWESEPITQRNGQNIVQLIFRVSEDATRRNAYVHRGCQCNSCGMVPIHGIRYRCANCADFDLCEACESQQVHNKTHVFYKVRVPAPTIGPRQQQPVWYPGDPETATKTLPRDVIARFTKETAFERPEIEAHWEQWTFMAATEWRDDPDGLYLAMDRRTFEQCLVPSGGHRNVATELIHDRMFSFYDTNNDNLIGFSEFLHGLAFRKKKDKLRKVFEGYDIDSDGYVDRKDFLRIFRSYYNLYKELHRDLVEGLDEQMMAGTESVQLITGRPVLSSAFGRDGRFPAAVNSHIGEGKVVADNQVDLEVIDDRGAINESGTDQDSRENVIASSVQTRSSLPTITAALLPSSDIRDAYWEALVNPPETIDELQHGILDGLLRERQRQNPSAGITFTYHDRSGEVEPEFTGDFPETDGNLARYDADRWPPPYVTEADVIIHCGQMEINDVPREKRIAVVRSALERLRHRDIYRRAKSAKQAIHERWQRRQFYTDEEEGLEEPIGYNIDDEIPLQNGVLSDSMKESAPISSRSRSSSKVRFVEDTDDYDTRSNPSTSSRSVPERWGGMDIPDAEKDVGKEILFQVVQQSFNELLDPLFEELESTAIAVMRTKELRDKWRHVFSASSFEEEVKEHQESGNHNPQPSASSVENDGTRDANDLANTARFRLAHLTRVPDIPDVELDDVRQRPLEQLLAFAGFSVELEESGNNTNEAETTTDTIAHIYEPVQEEDGQEHRYLNLDIQETGFPPDLPSNDIDLTMPQFRPNSLADTNVAPARQMESFDPTMPHHRPNNSFTPEHSHLPESGTESFFVPDSDSSAPRRYGSEKDRDTEAHVAFQSTEKTLDDDEEPERWELIELKRYDSIEMEAKKRGGWARMNYEEFENSVKGYGNRFDYLGSWIEFCIP